MEHSEQMKAVENRVFALRLTMSDALAVAKVAHSTWSRAKARGFIRARTLGRVEEAVAFLEKQAAAQPGGE